jgi:hypothetical protein
VKVNRPYSSILFGGPATVSIGTPISNSSSGGIIPAPITVDNGTSLPTGVTTAELTAFDSEVVLNKTYPWYRYVWPELILHSVPGVSYRHWIKPSRVILIPLTGYTRSEATLRDIMTPFDVTIRQCQPGEYISGSSCLSCEPVHQF